MDLAHYRMVIPSDYESVQRAESFLLNAIAEHDYSEVASFAVRLAVEEAIVNAIKHGNRLDPRKTVAIDMDVDASRVEIIVTDQGPGFDVASVPDPTAQENLEKPSGRGIMLMRFFMDEIRFNARGNQVTMVKRNA